MNKKTVIAEILDCANNLDNANYVDEADMLTKIAVKLAQSDFVDEEFFPEYHEDSEHGIQMITTIKCDCGNKVELGDPMTNECQQCGQLYNGSGQRLKDPSKWKDYDNGAGELDDIY